MYLSFGFVQAKTLSLVITIFTVVILLILCARKPWLCFVVGKKKDTDLLFLLFFRRSLPSEVF